MKITALLCFLPLLVCLSCAGHRHTVVHQPGTVFPSFTAYPAQKNLPAATIASLPRRIKALLGGKPLSIRQVVKRLGLSRYRDNVSLNLRWSTYFMYLDAEHILYFEVDANTLPEVTDSFSTPWGALVTSIRLRQNPDSTLAEKTLGKSDP